MLPYFEIENTGPLSGQIQIQGSKNAVLPMMAAAVLYPGVTVLCNVPDIMDVRYMMMILESLGCRVTFREHMMAIDATNITSVELPQQWIKTMRSSIILLGPLLSRCKEVITASPGGCSIGERPIDLHLQAMEQLGARVEIEGDKIFAGAKRLQGTTINLPFPSVGATENILMACVYAEGTTTICNAALEPEIIKLCEMLTQMGAKITGAGTSCIRIEGVQELIPVSVSAYADRIVTATYMAAIAGCGGDVRLVDAPVEQLHDVIAVFKQMGCVVWEEGNALRFIREKPLQAVGLIRTAPYPGFPTDAQSQFMAALTIAKGNTIIEETVFEGRFKTAEQLQKMGADILVNGQQAIIRGTTVLTGTAVEAQDLRGGAALVIAGLMAEGVTRIYGCNHICRGYEGIDRDLNALGANIQFLNPDIIAESLQQII